MLCNAMLRYDVISYDMLCYAMLRYVMLRYVLLRMSSYVICHPSYDVHVQSAAVLKLEARGVAVDVLDASGGHADASLHHELFDDGGHAAVHAQGHEELGVRESPRGFLVPLENAAVPGELPLGRGRGEEEVGHLLVLPADVLELGPFMLPEHGEALHPGGHVLRSAPLVGPSLPCATLAAVRSPSPGAASSSPRRPPPSSSPSPWPRPAPALS